MKSFEERLLAAMIASVAELGARVGRERLYARRQSYGERDPTYLGEVGDRRLRFSAPDWKYHDSSAELRGVELPGG